ncbi:unnamed protein product, partial [Amoebophrya sp. A25]|eukprot:GSA25T00015864001.1
MEDASSTPEIAPTALIEGGASFTADADHVACLKANEVPGEERQVQVEGVDTKPATYTTSTPALDVSMIVSGAPPPPPGESEAEDDEINVNEATGLLAPMKNVNAVDDRAGQDVVDDGAGAKQVADLPQRQIIREDTSTKCSGEGSSPVKSGPAVVISEPKETDVAILSADDITL